MTQVRFSAARYRKAANRIRERGDLVTRRALAKDLGVSEWEVTTVLNNVTQGGVKYLAEELLDKEPVPLKKRFVRYREAAREIKNAGGIVTFESLADHLGMRAGTVKTFFERWPDFGPKIGVKVGSDRTVAKTTIAMKRALTSLVQRRIQITVVSLARELRASRSALNRKLNKYLALKRLLIQAQDGRTWAAELAALDAKRMKASALAAE